MIFCLLIFINRKPKTLIIWASIFFVINCAYMYGEHISTPAEKAAMATYNKEQAKVYSEGSYSEILDFRFNAKAPEKENDVIRFSPMLYSPLFLVGMAFAKWRFFENLKVEGRIYRWALVLVPIALILKIIGQFDHVYKDMAVIAGQQILSLGYVFLFNRYWKS